MSDQPTAHTAPTGEGRVVVGVDGSEHSLRAVDRAAGEAARRGTALQLLYAHGLPARSRVPVTDADLERLRTAAAELVDEAALRAVSRLPGLRTVPSVHIETEAPQALVQASRDAALTVVGSRGIGGFGGLLVGSVGLRVAVHCQGPLMLVGARRGEDAEERGTTLVAVRGDAAADDVALRYGFDDAARRGAAVRLLHVWSTRRMPGRLRLPAHEAVAAREHAATLVADAARRHRDRSPRTEVSAEEQGGSPAAVLIEASRSADVLVLATHHRRHPLELRLGSVAHAVLHHAHCPVVLVPAAA